MDAAVPTDSLSMDDFFAQGNALERGTPAPEVVAPVVVEEAAVVAEEPPAGMERDAAGKFVAKAKDAPVVEKKPRNDPQARIDAVVREREEARREAAALKAENEALKRPRVEQPKPQEAARPAEQPQTQAEYARFKAMPGYPKGEDFTDYDDLTLARQVFVDRVLRREDGERARDQHQRQQHEQATRSLDEAWKGRLAEAREKSPDLIAGINPDTPLSAPMMHIIKKSTVGIEVLKHLSDHQELAQRLSTLHPDEALWEMGKLEARLEAATSGSAPIPEVSKAKAPIRPLGSTPVTSADGPPDDSASVDKHIAYYNGIDRKARRA